MRGGRTRLVSCTCEAGQARQAVESERLLQLYRQMGLTPQAQHAHLADFADQPQLQRMAEQLVYDGRVTVKDREYSGLLLIGPTGVGKTHLASAIVNAAYEQGKPALYTSTSAFLQALRRSYDRDAPANYDAVFNRACYAPLLVLDDFGTQRDTDWAWEQLYLLLDWRTGYRMPTVVTSNHSLRDLAERTDDWNVERIISRLRLLAQVRMQGADRR